MELANKIRITRLIDIYGALFTKKQQEYLTFYYDEDLSLNEIGEYFKVSKQAVSENIRRSEQQLESYEEKLGFLKKLEAIENIIKNQADKEDIKEQEMIKKIYQILDL